MNWDNENDYAYAKKNDIGQWAWEFIRRNPKYNEQWKAKLEEFYAGFSPNQGHIELEKSGLAKPFYNFSDPTKDDFRIISERSDWGQENNEWGLMDFFNPAVIRPHSPMFPRPGNTLVYIKDPRVINNFHMAHSNSLLFTLKMGIPIDPQLRMLKEQAKKLEREKLGRNLKTIKTLKSELWIRYIRFSDAKIANAKPKIIKAILFDNISDQTPEDQYRETGKQAKKMVSEGYKDLVASILYYS